MSSLAKRTLSKLVGVAGLNMINDTPGGRRSGGRVGAASGRGGGSLSYLLEEEEEERWP